MENIEQGWEGVEIIHAYTRAQALEDGVLVDLSLCRDRHKVNNADLRIMPSSLFLTRNSRRGRRQARARRSA